MYPQRNRFYNHLIDVHSVSEVMVDCGIKKSRPTTPTKLTGTMVCKRINNSEHALCSFDDVFLLRLTRNDCKPARAACSSADTVMAVILQTALGPPMNCSCSKIFSEEDCISASDIPGTNECATDKRQDKTRAPGTAGCPGYKPSPLCWHYKLPSCTDTLRHLNTALALERDRELDLEGHVVYQH